MNKYLFFFLLSWYFISTANAQDFPYGQWTTQELYMKNYAGDTSAHAVVLQEYGKSRIGVDNDDNIKVFYEYHVKIKLFDSKGFDNGTVKIPVYNNSDGDLYERVEDIAGETHFINDQGAPETIQLETKKIYPVKENKHLAHYNFALPGLRNGCIIEYKYELTSPYWWDFPTWKFQSDIPKIYSEYEAHIPAYWDFNVSLKGYLKLSKTSAVLESKCFSLGAANCDCSVLVYGMKDIPAFIDEDYMTAEKNYLSAINFVLSDYTNLSTGVKIKWTKEWKDIDYQLKDEMYFFGQIKKKGLFKDRIAPLIAGETDDLNKAKRIYEYIKKLYKWNDEYGKYSPDGLSKAIEAHTANVADINLSLINALSAAGLNTEAVLLSTRDNGAINTLYPVIDDFDYVIAKVNINGQSYLLDATEPLLPFGMLPLRCLNDKGRVFSMDKPSYWMDMNQPKPEKTSYLLDFTLADNGKIKGTFTRFSSGYAGYEKRKAIKKFNTTDEYIEDLAGNAKKIKILKSEISNLDSLEKPLIETYDVEMNLFDNVNSGSLAFNPFFFEQIKTNPFKLAERSFPVDWGMPSEDTFILTMHLPPNYTIETRPEILNIRLPDEGGRFITDYQPGENSFTFSNGIIFNKSIYTAEEYPYLKELYNRIIQSEKAEMIFKKK